MESCFGEERRKKQEVVEMVDLADVVERRTRLGLPGVKSPWLIGWGVMTERSFSFCQICALPHSPRPGLTIYRHMEAEGCRGTLCRATESGRRAFHLSRAC